MKKRKFFGYIKAFIGIIKNSDFFLWEKIRFYYGACLVKGRRKKDKKRSDLSTRYRRPSDLETCQSNTM